MHTWRNAPRDRRLTVFVLVFVFPLCLPDAVKATAGADRAAFQRQIIDYLTKLNPRFRKVART